MKYILMIVMMMFFSLSAYDSDHSNVIDTSWILTPVLILFLMGIPLLALFQRPFRSDSNFPSSLLVCVSVSAMSSALWFLIFYMLAFVTGTFF